MTNRVDVGQSGLRTKRIHSALNFALSDVHLMSAALSTKAEHVDENKFLEHFKINVLE